MTYFTFLWECSVVGYTLLLSLIEYKTLVMRGDLDRANQILPTIPKEQHNNVAHFLESRGMIEDALEIATDADYKFDLAIQLGRLEMAKEIAEEVQSESKWKQLGELAMSSGKLQLTEDCMKYAMDLSGLLLLYSSLGDAEGVSKLACLAKEQGKNNVAFLCLFTLGRLEDCLQLLVESNRIPEAALMARFYLPSKVSEIVALWREDLSKVNSKAAESLADPEEYPNLFEDWQVALSVEGNTAKTRGVYTAAENYPSHADKSSITLVEAFRNLQVEAEESLENGDVDHEVAEENGHVENEGDEEEQQENHSLFFLEEEGVVDADSTDGAVLVNGSEGEEEWVLTPDP
ncbi:PREDICTED: coatomer subunit beta'-3-like isoform X2 [Camelina sativa]|uniref:Coatomer subunit beta'-3-like isoform X2 n=1 Tax=Camelina sativa TaxID=90675 RepID=A0ABM0XKU8_CAMSA|nr:PREDICTED: coatomer subunit beta'-3-like isoform X2 [Camelina sativa]